MRQKSRLVSIPMRVWNFFCYMLGVFTIVFGFIYFLNSVSERSGYIVEVVDDPKSPLFVAGRKENNTQVMRVALGKSINYTLNWKYIEGGCDSTVHIEYEQVLPEPPKTSIVIETKGRGFPVGFPGSDKIERTLPAGIVPGLWHYTVYLDAICANGRRPPSQKLVDFYLDIYDSHVPAIELTAPVEVRTPVLKETDKLKFQTSFYRNLEGQITAIYSFVNLDKSSNDIITFQKPTSLTRLGPYENSDVVLDLPPEIYPGRWQMLVSTLTNLPSGKSQVDPLLDIEFEVKP